MKPESFDRITMAMAAQQSRRGLLKTFVAGLGAAALGAFAARPSADQPPAEASAPFNALQCRLFCIQLFGNNTAAMQNCVNQAFQGLGPCGGDSCRAPGGPAGGCFQQCVNGPSPLPPGGSSSCACVTTVEGISTCTHEICTFQTCTSSAQCPTGQVCFTQGCCGGGSFCVPACDTPVSASLFIGATGVSDAWGSH